MRVPSADVQKSMDWSIGAHFTPGGRVLQTSEPATGTV
jgi:hypothetical protein